MRCFSPCSPSNPKLQFSIAHCQCPINRLWALLFYCYYGSSSYLAKPIILGSHRCPFSPPYLPHTSTQWQCWALFIITLSLVLFYNQPVFLVD
ncbi:hypothetical protein BDV36DRAFT_253994 [Aspergillus pseudocaelatus]|uniref:Uncharacterized protein n=1 Tax=Aspergillus pseudocaelatus TaxID=1825620 RepID=A0ABQ6WMW5_9EURO|nr:hypothetical protein BDV36DRAFT_253994 [Aspergillus pseudocaelatus]